MVIFHNFRGCDSHLIIRETGKFDVKVNVIPNGLEKYVAFKINNNLVSIDSLRFMNSSLQIRQKTVLNIYHKNLVVIC